MKNRIKNFAAVVFFCLALFPLHSVSFDNHARIERLTFSGNNQVLYPCLSHDGSWMLYILEIKENDSSTKAVIAKNLETGEEKELFRDREHGAPAPFENTPLLLGTKPPLLSGDSRTAIFSLSLDEPGHLLDHYLGVVDIDGKDLQIISFPIKSLEGIDIESLEFTSSDWERISVYAVGFSRDRIACMLKGHLGPRRFGNPSGIILLDTSNNTQRTVLAPDFVQDKWEWSSSPSRPLTGGGWAFALSGNGERLVFGARSSEDKTDYDLYITDWEAQEFQKLTDFHDRWFSMADLSHDGQRIVFYYAGKKKQGIGTYTLETADSTTNYLESKTSPRIDFIDLSEDGKHILYKRVYTGMMFDLQANEDRVIYSEKTPGYVSGLFPMDFPSSPAFWRPNIIDFSGNKVLLIGAPQGKLAPEVYLLTLGLSAQD